MAVAQNSRFPQSLAMDKSLNRPQSALARGVQITEFTDSRVNPKPVVLEETDVLMEQYLSPRKLQMLTGVDNLDDIKQLEMKVNTTDTSLGNFGILLPNLRQLKVSNSTIPYIRDLGSSLRSLQVLWASRCALLELDGISSMCNLQEVYLSYNEIADISPLSMLDQIEILDLEGNNIDDIVQVQYLSFCSKLTNLTLDGNPICVAPAEGQESIDYDYRQEVKKAIPHLQTLDDEVLIEGVGSFQKHNGLDADWAYLEELQRDISLSKETDADDSDAGNRPPSGHRPSTASQRPNTGYRPGSVLRPSSGFRPMTSSVRPSTVGARPATAGVRPSSGSAETKNKGPDVSDASDLTLGKVICGNPSKALLSRRRLNPDASGELDGPSTETKFEPKFHHKPEHTYDPLPEETRDRAEIASELKAWRAQHELRMEKIRAAQAPQVLRIDHDDAISLSGDDSEVDSDVEDDQAGATYLSAQSEGVSLSSSVEQNISSFLPTAEVGGVSKELPHPQRNVEHIDHSDNSRQALNFTSSDSVLPKGPATPFKISDYTKRNNEMILPPSKRDIVRQLQPASSSPIDLNNPLQPLRPEMRRSLSSDLKVNTATGLPRASVGSSPVVPVIGRSRGLDEQQRLMKSSSLERPVPPLSQRPSTARAALAISSQPKIRRSLPTAPGLPSKPPVPPK